MRHSVYASNLTLSDLRELLIHELFWYDDKTTWFLCASCCFCLNGVQGDHLPEKRKLKEFTKGRGNVRELRKVRKNVVGLSQWESVDGLALSVLGEVEILANPRGLVNWNTTKLFIKNVLNTFVTACLLNNHMYYVYDATYSEAKASVLWSSNKPDEWVIEYTIFSVVYSSAVGSLRKKWNLAQR